MTSGGTARQSNDAERTTTIVLCAVTAVQALLGLLIPGAYRDAEWIRATWFGNDLVTLAVVVPVLLVSMLSAYRGSARGRLVLLGTLAYGVYNYAYYLLGAALNAFFALYVAAVILSAGALILGLVRTDAASMAEKFAPRTPARMVGGYYVFVAIGLSLIWLGMWAAYAFAGRPTPVETEAFHLVAALDMTLLVPALAVGGVLLWRRAPWGFVIAATAGVQSSLYLLVLSVNSAVAIMRELVAAPGELPVWGMLLVLTLAATVWLLKSVGGERSAPTQIEAP